MTLEDIITLSKAGFNAQQITQLAQAQQVPQQAPQQVPQQVPQQMVQQMPQQMPQPTPQQAYQVPQQVQQLSAGGQYVPVLPNVSTQGSPSQSDPLADVMRDLHNNQIVGTTFAPNSYNVNDIVKGMIGANEPVQKGGQK